MPKQLKLEEFIYKWFYKYTPSLLKTNSYNA